VIATASETRDYLLHRVGVTRINRPVMITKALGGNVAAPAFFETFGNSLITAYVGFLDLAGFSTIVQGKSADEIASYLTPFLRDAIGVLAAGGALVDKMIGDELMFVLPETEESANPPEVLRMGQILGGLHDLAFELGPQYRYRLGLSHGKVKVFQLKTDAYEEWTVVGEPVHVAKRLHGLPQLAEPNPVCGAFGLSVGSRNSEDVTAEMRIRLSIMAGAASRFDHEFLEQPTSFKGVGEVRCAVLASKRSRAEGRT